MRILVYGAGVLGSYMTHVLLSGGNDVTLLARGDWKKTIEKNGLVIRHYVQLKTTRDRPRVIGELLPDNIYDIIFVIMQYSQIPSVLPALGANGSRLIVFVGNNMSAEETEKALAGYSAFSKQVVFGFQGTAGRRENGRVICVRMGGSMTAGSLNDDTSWEQPLRQAFSKNHYRLTFCNNMDMWLKEHAAFILPVCYICYACAGDLRKAAGNKELLNRTIDAIGEGYRVLESLGYPIPEEDTAFFRKNRKKLYLMLKIMAATPIGYLVASAHSMSAVKEMAALTCVFDGLKEKAGIPVPTWDSLEYYMTQKKAEL